ncbi:hypothetical protein LCGC14_3085350, partial [marine sediment metagenome]
DNIPPAIFISKSRADPVRMCWYCGKEAKSTCSKCKIGKFCNRECQSKYWPIHKQVCDEIFEFIDLTPLTVGVIADCIGAPEKQVQSALKRLSEPDIGWITVEVGVQSDDSPPLVATRARSLHSTPLHSTPLQSKEDKSTANEICRIPPTEITGNSYYLTAKKKKLHGNTLLSFIDFCKAFGGSEWKHHIYKLAIAENRIEYIAGFVE